MLRRHFLQMLLPAIVMAADSSIHRIIAASSAAGFDKSKSGGSILISAAAWAQFQTAMKLRSDAQELLRKDADEWLSMPPPNIVLDKKHIAPSGDPHDYISIQPYAWPDPNKANHLIHRDGEVNPLFYEYDSIKFETLCQAIRSLTLYACLSGSATHAERAGLFLRAWFLDKDTCMNPHLRFAQGGSAGGIIDTSSLIFLLDLVSRLPLNAKWTADDLIGLKKWVSDYLNWLQSSPNGKKEEAASNNHGTWFDAQVATYAMFIGKPDIATQQIKTHTFSRITAQIEPDGRQPFELKRTLGITYCTYNLLSYACLAQIGTEIGIDLWNWKSGDRRGILSAFDWMLPYYSGSGKWPAQQIRPFDPASAAILINLAWQGTGDAALNSLCEKLATQPWQRITFSKQALAIRYTVEK